MNINPQHASSKRGFTLLELLIVIAIIAILSVVVVLVLNPAETLRKTRDAQRISDLNTMKTALGLYLTDVSSPDLDTSVVDGCLTGTNVNARIFYSSPATDAAFACTAAVASGADVGTGTNFDNAVAIDFCYNVASPNASIDGAGWLPVDLRGISGGSPLSNYPLDPTNTAMTATPSSTMLVYRYACQQGTVTGTNKPSPAFELNAQLESTAYTVTDNKRATDGGDNDNYYEVGTSLKLIGTGTNF